MKKEKINDSGKKIIFFLVSIENFTLGSRERNCQKKKPIGSKNL